MRLQELFLVETTEEDRALISLSSSIYDYLRKYVGSSEDEIEVGKIGDIFNTPFNVFDDAGIVLMSDDLMKEYAESDNVTLGMWEPEKRQIVLNKDYLESNMLKSTITHELRHALDDYKSGFKASSSNRYSTPKNKEHRKAANDPYVQKTSYLAQPAEINARFLQVMHAVTVAIKRASKLPPDQMRANVMGAFNNSMLLHKISMLFPERTASRDYKRLVKRAVDFIDKEIADIQSKK